MNPPLPPEIRVETGARSTRYLLPHRDTGPLKVMAVFMIGFGMLFGGFAVVWMFAALGITQKDGIQLSGVLFALFGLPFLAVGLGIIGLGMFALCGRSEIEVRSRELIVRERGGPFWWTRRIPSKDIKRLMLVTDAVRINGKAVQSGAMADAATLGADVGSTSPRLVVLGYPRVWMEPFAARLNADLALQSGHALPPPVTQPVLHTAVNLDGMSGDRSDPPAGTTIRVTEQAGGIVVVVPPQGARRTRGLFFFAIIWLVFVSIFALAFAFAPENPKRRRSNSKVAPVAITCLFGVIGLGLLTTAVNQMRRKASIRASRDELIIVQQSIFGTQTFKRTNSEVGAIRVGSSGMEINNVPVLELQIHSTNGKKHGFFTHLTNEELHWLATHLRGATGVGEVPGESGEPPKLSGAN